MDWQWVLKESVRSRVIPRKVGVGLKGRIELLRVRVGRVWVWAGSRVKRQTSHLEGLSARRQDWDHWEIEESEDWRIEVAILTSG